MFTKLRPGVWKLCLVMFALMRVLSFAGDLAKQQALRLLYVGIGAVVWDFWTWFFNGNCAPYIQAMPEWTNTWNAMPDLGFR